MMRKYGIENINNHFMSFNTICDATQVFPVPLTCPSLALYLLNCMRVVDVTLVFLLWAKILAVILLI